MPVGRGGNGVLHLHRLQHDQRFILAEPPGRLSTSTRTTVPGQWARSACRRRSPRSWPPRPAPRTGFRARAPSRKTVTRLPSAMTAPLRRRPSISAIRPPSAAAHDACNGNHAFAVFQPVAAGGMGDFVCRFLAIVVEVEPVAALAVEPPGVAAPPGRETVGRALLPPLSASGPVFEHRNGGHGAHGLPVALGRFDGRDAVGLDEVRVERALRETKGGGPASPGRTGWCSGPRCGCRRAHRQAQAAPVRDTSPQATTLAIIGS